jgi:hypothetical protein
MCPGLVFRRSLFRLQRLPLTLALRALLFKHLALDLLSSAFVHHCPLSLWTEILECEALVHRKGEIVWKRSSCNDHECLKKLNAHAEDLDD